MDVSSEHVARAHFSGVCKGIITGSAGTLAVVLMALNALVGYNPETVIVEQGGRKIKFVQFGTCNIDHVNYDFVNATAYTTGENSATLDFSQFDPQQLRLIADLAQKALKEHITTKREEGSTLPNWVIGSEAFFNQYVENRPASTTPDLEPPAPKM
ncbi:MAG: hypothetical protein L6Q57_05465 [Alphaproteobacteria bacterium]|nr:hypothetical protein [Alphaproteobacteria bacterium]